MADTLSIRTAGIPHMNTRFGLDRRTFLLATISGASIGVVPAGLAEAQVEVTRPAVSEVACPLEIITPTARDGYRGLGVLRKPPGNGPFPGIICLHDGAATFPLPRLQSYARDTAIAS